MSKRAWARIGCASSGLPFVLLSSFYLCLIGFSPTFVDAAFDDDFASARSLGMGSAYVALVNDGDGLLMNPAGIWQISGQQLTATYASLYAGLSDGSSLEQQLASYVQRRSETDAFGVVWKRFSVSHLYSEDVYALAYAKRYQVFKGSGEERTLRFAFALGGGLRVLRWDAAPTVGPDGQLVEDLSGPFRVALDLGILIYLSERTPVAIVFQNLNQPDIVSSEATVEERQPIRSRFGISLQSENLIWDLDLLFHRHQVDLSTGVEWAFIPERILFRAGVQLQNLAWGTNVSIGAGYHPTPALRIDYAFMQPIQGIDSPWGSHRVSVVYDF